MHRLPRCWTHLVLLVFCVLALAATPGQDQTALDRYVAAPDPNYSYKLVNTIAGEGATTYVLEMTSQAWLTEKEVNRTVWKHWLLITRPDEVTTSIGLLYITGGGNDTHQVYIAGVPHHRLKDANVVDHLVELIEKKAAEIEAAKKKDKAEETDRHRAAAE